MKKHTHAHNIVFVYIPTW